MYIFPAHVDLSSVMKILAGNCNRETLRFILKNTLWLNRLCLDLSQKNSNECLTIVCRGINQRGSAKFRTRADNPEEERSYLHVSSNDKLLHTYLAKRILNNDFDNDNLQDENFSVDK